MSNYQLIKIGKYGTYEGTPKLTRFIKTLKEEMEKDAAEGEPL
jgi:hypothetical protein